MHTLLVIAALVWTGADGPLPPPPPSAAVFDFPLVAEASAAEPAPELLPSPAPRAATPAPVQAAGRSDLINYNGVRVAFEIGERVYSDGDWGGTGDATALGFTFTQEPAGMPVGWDAGFFWTNEKGNVGPLEITTHTGEFYAGVMKSFTFARDKLRFELGGGAALDYVYANADGLSFDDDWYASAYGRSLLGLRLGSTAMVGLAYKANFGGSARIYGTDLAGDYQQFTFVIGTVF